MSCPERTSPMNTRAHAKRKREQGGEDGAEAREAPDEGLQQGPELGDGLQQGLDEGRPGVLHGGMEVCPALRLPAHCNTYQETQPNARPRPYTDTDNQIVAGGPGMRTCRGSQSDCAIGRERRRCCSGSAAVRQTLRTLTGAPLRASTAM